MKIWRMIAPIAVAASCCGWAVSNAKAVCPGGVIAFGFENCPLGNAVLSTNGFGQVVISNIGPSGGDGAEVFIQRVQSVVSHGRLDLSEPDSYEQGAFVAFSATGDVSESENTPLFFLQLLRDDNEQMGFFSSVTITPDFGPIGASFYTAMIISNGVTVAVQPMLSGPIFVADDPFTLRGLSPPVLGFASATIQPANAQAGLRGQTEPDLRVTLGWGQTVNILLPSGLGPRGGDTLELAVQAAAGAEIATLQTLRLTGRNLGSITITNESATVRGLGSIPTLSEWGLIVMLCGLLAAGGYLIKRRQPIPA